MGTIASAFVETFRDFVTDGVPATGAHKPEKAETRSLGSLIEAAIGNVTLAAMLDVVKDTRANLNADLAHAADSVAIVYADATDANNDLYVKVGGSGTGSWTLTTILHDAIGGAAQPYVDLAQAWAEGTEPGGPGTQSAKEYAADAAATLAGPINGLLDKTARIRGGLDTATLAGGNGATETSAASTFLYQAKGRTGKLESLSFYVSAVGNGQLTVALATGTLGGSLGLVGSVTALPAISSTGQVDLTGLDIDVAADQHILISSPTGGVKAATIYIAGTSGFYSASGAFTSGSKTLTLGNSPYAISMTGLFNEGGDPSIVRDDLAPTERDVYDALDRMVVEQEIEFGNTGVFYADAGNPQERNHVFAVIDRDILIDKLTVYISDLGTEGKLNLVHTRGADLPGNPGYVVGYYPISDVAATGLVIKTADDSDFTAFEAKAGDVLALYAPATTGARSTRQIGATGYSVYYSDAAPAPVVGNPGNGNVGAVYSVLPNSRVMAKVSGIGKVLDTSAAAYAPAPTEFDIFLIAGQSNAMGTGANSIPTAIPAGIAKQYYSGSLTEITGDPVGNANVGSPWPTFANEYFARTGRGVIFVPCAVSGSSLLAAADPTYTGAAGHWSSTGTLRGIAATAVLAAQAAANTAKLAWRMGGVLWIQGESDADARQVGAAGVTRATYKAELLVLKTYFEGQFGFGAGKLPFIVSKLGQYGATYTTGYSEIGAAQDEACQETAGFYMAYRGARWFDDRGLMGDVYHYGPQARIEVGNALAVTAAARCV